MKHAAVTCLLALSRRCLALAECLQASDPAPARQLALAFTDNPDPVPLPGNLTRRLSRRQPVDVRELLAAADSIQEPGRLRRLAVCVGGYVILVTRRAKPAPVPASKH